MTSVRVSQVILLGNALQQLLEETTLDIFVLSGVDSCLQKGSLPPSLPVLMLVAAALKRSEQSPP